MNGEQKPIAAEKDQGRPSTTSASGIWIEMFLTYGAAAAFLIWNWW